MDASTRNKKEREERETTSDACNYNGYSHHSSSAVGTVADISPSVLFLFQPHLQNFHRVGVV